jgi:hypothetical protein
MRAYFRIIEALSFTVFAAAAFALYPLRNNKAFWES